LTPREVRETDGTINSRNAKWNFVFLEMELSFKKKLV